MKIGACAFVQNEKNEILAIRCRKGRGLILAGGKMEKSDLTYRHCAARELEEETGVRVNPSDATLVHHGLGSTGKTYVYAYKFNHYDDSNMRKTKEGTPVWVHVSEIMFQNNCDYLPFYDLFLWDFNVL